MHEIILSPAFTDYRGIITDFPVEGINAITKISFTKGSIRGNHFHKLTTQWCYVIKGKVKVSTIINGNISSLTLSDGQMIVSLPGEPHSFNALKASEIIVFTSGPRAGKDYESDTYPIQII